MNFCHGQSQEFSYVQAVHNGNLTQDLERYINYVTVIGVIVLFTELFLYMAIFKKIYDEDLLRYSKRLRTRKVKSLNVTLSGQIMTFFLDTVAIVVIQAAFKSFEESYGQALVTIYLPILMTTFHSFFGIICNQELREYFIPT